MAYETDSDEDELSPGERAEILAMFSRGAWRGRGKAVLGRVYREGKARQEAMEKAYREENDQLYPVTVAGKRIRSREPFWNARLVWLSLLAVVAGTGLGIVVGLRWRKSRQEEKASSGSKYRLTGLDVLGSTK